MEALLCGLLLALGGVPAAWVGEIPSAALERAAPCPPLMTPAECRQHLDTLARLPEGRERTDYLVRHQALMADREQACRCAMEEAFPETASIPRP